MKKQFLLFILMFFISASIQFSACEESENKSSNCDTDINVNQPENQYRVNAQVFGGIEGCGIVTVEKDGEIITNAVVKLNGAELAFDETMGYASFLSNSSGDEIELEVTHEGSIIGSGKVCLPSFPGISNIDSGDVHQRNTDLTINWSAVSNATAIDVTIDEDITYGQYSSGLLLPTTTSHTVPSSFFNLSSDWSDTAECIINVTAYYGVSSEANYEDLDSTDLGYNINGSAGFFIGINGDETTIYVPISD